MQLEEIVISISDRVINSNTYQVTKNTDKKSRFNDKSNINSNAFA